MTIEHDDLEPGERILWQGKPDVDAYCRRRALPVPPLWIGLAVIAAGGALAAIAIATDDFSGALGTLALTLMLIGALLVYIRGRYRRDAKRVSYALTDRRAIIDTPGFVLPNRASVAYADMPEVVIRDDAVGDVLFRVSTSESEGGIQTWRDGFFAIENPRKVAGILQGAMDKSAKNPAARVPA
jgi:hypothetical protein